MARAGLPWKGLNWTFLTGAHATEARPIKHAIANILIIVDQRLDVDTFQICDQDNNSALRMAV